MSSNEDVRDLKCGNNQFSAEITKIDVLFNYLFFYGGVDGLSSSGLCVIQPKKEKEKK